MKRILILLAFALLVGALLQFFLAPAIWVWKLSIVTTESGHHLALFCLLLLLICRLVRVKALIVVVPLWIAAALYCVPLLQLVGTFKDWETQMDKVLGPDPAAGLGEPLRLLTGGLELEYQPEHREAHSKSGELLPFDFYPAVGNKKAPWILVVPGGSWSSLNRKDLWEWNSYLAKRGYAVAVASYRLLPKWQWPTQRDDIETIAEHVRSKAVDLGVDPDRWVILGRSAGGHIAESVAFRTKPAGLKGGIFIYAPSDLEFSYRFSSESDLIDGTVLIPEFLGGLPSERASVYKEASPLNDVASGVIPSLVVHGMQDPLVWSLHSQRLYGGLSKAGAQVILMNLPWATHGFDYDFAGPGALALRYGLDRFLRKVLP